jgi:hypothetical protein
MSPGQLAIFILVQVIAVLWHASVTVVILGIAYHVANSLRLYAEKSTEAGRRNK